MLGHTQSLNRSRHIEYENEKLRRTRSHLKSSEKLFLTTTVLPPKQLRNLPSSPSESTDPTRRRLSVLLSRPRGELAFEPGTIEPVLPKRTDLRVHRGMGALVRWALRRGTVCALTHVDAKRVDALEMVGLYMWAGAKGTARAFGTALI